MYTIALDIGGTKIVGALVKDTRIIKKIKVPTEAKKGKNHVIKKIIKIINLLIEGINKKNIKGIGLGMPGLLDSKKGIVLWLPNLPGWRHVPIKKIIEKKFKIRTEIENDTNCAAIAESKYFKSKNLVCLTLGTGLGGGIIIDGKIYRGEGIAGELGHIVINFEGPKCNCGNNGCLEEYFSVRGIKRIARKYGFNLGPKEIYEKARKGDKKAKAVYEEAGKYLGIAFANIINIFDPEIIVIGGGISNAEKFFLNSAIKEMKKRAFKYSQRNVKIMSSKLKEDAGILGVSYLI